MDYISRCHPPTGGTAMILLEPDAPILSLCFAVWSKETKVADNQLNIMDNSVVFTVDKRTAGGEIERRG